MNIVIDIPESIYKEIVSGQFDTDGYFKRNLSMTFKNGTPLPKGYAGEVVQILKDFLNWYTLPFNDTLFMHDDEIIAKYLKIMEEKANEDSD